MMQKSAPLLHLRLVWPMPLAAAEPRQDIAARTELHAIHTLTLSDKQFLTGDAEAKATDRVGPVRGCRPPPGGCRWWC